MTDSECYNGPQFIVENPWKKSNRRVIADPAG